MLIFKTQPRSDYLFESQQSTKEVWRQVLFKGYGWSAHGESAFYGIRALLTTGEHGKSLMLYLFGHKVKQFQLNLKLFVIACVLKALKYCHVKQYSQFCCDSVMVINISIHDSVKVLFMSPCFQQKNTFDVLTFIQMRTVLTHKKQDLFKVED